MYPCPLAVMWKSPCTLFPCMVPYILQLSAFDRRGSFGVLENFLLLFAAPR